MRSRMRAAWRHVGHAPRESVLDLDRAAHCRERARELGAHALGLELEDATAIDRDRRIDHLVVAELQGCLGPAAVVRDQALIVGHVGHQDRRELLLDVDPHDATPPARRRLWFPSAPQSKLRRPLSRKESRAQASAAIASALPVAAAGCPTARQRMVSSHWASHRSGPFVQGGFTNCSRSRSLQLDLLEKLCGQRGARLLPAGACEVKHGECVNPDR